MDTSISIYFRIFMFCFSDWAFHKCISFFLEEKNEFNSTVSNENAYSVMNGENSTVSANPCSMYLTTLTYSTIENSTFSLPYNDSTLSATHYGYTIICPIKMSFSTFGAHASLLTVFICTNMGFYLMNMLLLLTSWKRIPHFVFISAIPSTVIWGLNTYTQIFEFAIILESHWIFLIRIFVCLIISCFMYLQLRGEFQLPCILLTILGYFIVSLLNIESAEFYLIKYLLSAALIHMSVFKTSILKFISHKSNRIKIFLNFCFLYCLVGPLMFYTAEVFTCGTKNEWRDVLNVVFGSKGMVVFRVFIAVFLLSCITHTIYFIFDLLLSIKRENMSITLHSIEKLFFSPVIFYAFFIDKTLSVLNVEYMWWFLKPYVVIHILVILANFCNSIKQSMLDFDLDNNLKKIHRYILLLLICISSIIFKTLFYGSRPFLFESEVLLYLASFNVLFALMFMLLPFLKFCITKRSWTKVGKQMLWVCVLISLELYLTVLMYFAICWNLLMHFIYFCYYCGCAEVLVLIGGLYFALKSWCMIRKNYGPINTFLRYYGGFRDVGKRDLEMVKDIGCCRICDKEMSSGCCKTFCGHYYHSNCLIKWMCTNNECPECKADLYGCPKTYFRVVKKVALV